MWSNSDDSWTATAWTDHADGRIGSSDDSWTATAWKDHADDGSGSWENSDRVWTGGTDYPDHWSNSDHTWTGWADRADGGSGWTDYPDYWSNSDSTWTGWADCLVGDMTLTEYLDAEFTRRMQAPEPVAEELLMSLRAAEAALVEIDKRFDVMGGQIAECLDRMNGQPGSVQVPVVLPSPPPPPPRRASTPSTCQHFVCNVPVDVYSEIENMHVTNAYRVETNDQLWAWTSHLTSTVLSQHGGLADELAELFSRHLPRFNILYCMAQGNRFMLVRCKVCGQALYGKYPRGQKVHEVATVAAVAAFLGVQLETDSTEV